MDRVRTLREELLTPSPTPRPTCGSIKYYDALKCKHAETKHRRRASSLSSPTSKTALFASGPTTTPKLVALRALRAAATTDTRCASHRVPAALNRARHASYSLAGRASAFTPTLSVPAVRSSSSTAAKSPFGSTGVLVDDYAAQYAIAVSVAESALR